MIERSHRQNILQSLSKYPVVAILGSRQVGKTTLAKTLSAETGRDTIYLDLELDSDLNKLKNPELYLRQFADSLVIIDEIQRMPALFPLMRALVDQKRVGGRFLILGSASPDLIRHSSKSLAGRIIYHELTPFNLAEVWEDLHALPYGSAGDIPKVIFQATTMRASSGVSPIYKRSAKGTSPSWAFISRSSIKKVPDHDCPFSRTTLEWKQDSLKPGHFQHDSAQIP